MNGPKQAFKEFVNTVCSLQQNVKQQHFKPAYSKEAEVQTASWQTPVADPKVHNNLYLMSFDVILL